MDLYTVFFVLIMATMSSAVNVLDFGAVGDGNTDDSPAFLKAWESVCGTSRAESTLKIPADKKYLLQPVIFQGPCQFPSIYIEVQGYIIAPSKMSDWTPGDVRSWIEFRDVNGLIVDGDGVFDGQGADWWTSCSSDGCPRPNALRFSSCENLKFGGGLGIIYSPRGHISLHGCNNAEILNINIYSPDDSPNTDGIDIGRSTNIFLHDSKIESGDDCVAIKTGSSHINVTGVTCGLGHGISIGSLGKNGEDSAVEEVHVQNCTFYATQNGARIKTWQGGKGYARKISFQDIWLIGTKNPIFIDQFYCPHEFCDNQTDAVKISEVSFTEFQGTSWTTTPIKLSCCESIGCTDIVLKNINITFAAPDVPVTSFCLNAHGKSTDTFPPVSGLLP